MEISFSFRFVSWFCVFCFVQRPLVEFENRFFSFFFRLICIDVVVDDDDNDQKMNEPRIVHFFLLLPLDICFCVCGWLLILILFRPLEFDFFFAAAA